MPFVAVPGAYSCDLHYTLDGQNIHNIFGVAPLNPAAPFSMPAVVNAIGAWAMEDWMTNFSSDLILQEVSLRNLGFEGAEGVFADNVTPTAGSKTTNSCPNNVAFCLTLRTLLAGRSYRGRLYAAGLAETDVNRSRLDPVVASEIIASGNALLDQLTTGINAMMVVISRYHNKVPRTPPLFTQVHLVAAFDNVVDSQRRRLPGRGT